MGKMNRTMVRKRSMPQARKPGRKGGRNEAKRDAARWAIRPNERIRGPPQTLDRRAHHCLAQSLPQARQGLGESQSQGPRVLATRFNPPHAPKALQPSMIFPDRLLV